VKLLLENWREYLLTEADLPGDASVIAINPHDYVGNDWQTDLTDDLQSYIAFNLDKYLEVFEEEGGDWDWKGPIAKRANEYFYCAVNTAVGCETEAGTAYQTSGTAGVKGIGWTAYLVAAGMRNAPIMPHRTGPGEIPTSDAAAKVWLRLAKRSGAKVIDLGPPCPETGRGNLNFALELDGIRPTEVTGDLTPEQIKGLLTAWAYMFETRYEGEK